MSGPLASEIRIALPGWLRERPLPDRSLGSADDRVRLAYELAVENIARDSGGPFAAVIFDRDTQRPVAWGVNLVPSSGLSSMHAEIVAISFAQKLFGSFDLAAHELELVSSCEPCAMCTGAVQWSGVHALLYGATSEDARAAGFDEGDKPADWADGLRRRGVEVKGPTLAKEGRAVLFEYTDNGGKIYNPGRRPSRG
ncbi:MAG: Guanine deaminase [Calditrichaeota bacterium]|nr:Guanine deaminase [Calditrichota bacterium]